MDDGSVKLGKIYMENRFAHKAWDPAALLTKGLEYFKWCTDNPRHKQTIDRNGEVITVDLPRVPTKEGLSLFLGISRSTLHNYSNKPEYSEVISTLVEMIHDHQIGGGMVDTYNANLVARYTGLSDKQHVTQETKPTVDDKAELQAELGKLLDKDKDDGVGEGA